ncbi:MAG: response regulator [Candidatus Shapirobacteria bacterium]
MKKILIAEDDKFLSSAYRFKLTKAGFDVQIVGDGAELLTNMGIRMPDLILLDLVMPVMDGFTTLESIRSNPRYKTIPIIVASNLGQKEDIDRTKELGATDFVVKSDMSLDSLIEKINKLVS